MVCSLNICRLKIGIRKISEALLQEMSHNIDIPISVPFLLFTLPAVRVNIVHFYYILWVYYNSLLFWLFASAVPWLSWRQPNVREMRNLNEHHHIVLSPAPISLTLSLLLRYWLGGPANSVYVQTEKGGGGLLNNVVLVLNWVFSFGCSDRLETTQAGSAEWKAHQNTLLTCLIKTRVGFSLTELQSVKKILLNAWSNWNS